jgi:hypothetical protein
MSHYAKMVKCVYIVACYWTPPKKRRDYALASARISAERTGHATLMGVGSPDALRTL